MEFDLLQLAALRSAVDEGTFEAAARALRVTPSAVSQRIKALESSVGRVLLTRTKPIRPTESGVALLRLARQIGTLADDVSRSLGESGGSSDGTAGDSGSGAGPGSPGFVPVRMPIAVNADSLATWLLPGLAGLTAEVAFEFFREDESHTTALLREGTVTAAVTATAHPVQGCSSAPLGVMRYEPMASRAFLARWFPDGVTAEALARAPVVVFDRRDQLQDVYLRSRAGLGDDPGGVPADPPRHFVPGSVDFTEAVRLGYGWGMVPEQQQTQRQQQQTTQHPQRPRAAAAAATAADDPRALVRIDAGYVVDVPLYWQQWQLHTPTLARVAEQVRLAADAALRPMPLS